MTVSAALFATALRSLRMLRGMSQFRLAELAGCDHSYISRIERGQRLPSREIIERFAVALGLDAIEARKLYLAAGYAPPHEPLDDDADVFAMRQLLADPRVPWGIQVALRQGVRSLVELGREAQGAA